MTSPRKSNRIRAGKRQAGPGQPRIDPAAPLERRSVGLPVSWWKEIDRLAERRGVKTAAIVRLAVGLQLKKIRRILDALPPERT